MVHVNVDPKEILENRFTWEDAKFYLRSVGPGFAVMLLLSVMFFALGAMSGRPLHSTLSLGSSGLIILALCVAKLVSTRVKTNKKMKTMVDKYGRGVLETDLRDLNNAVYMLHPEKYETYVIVSSRYLYFAKEAVFALDDITEAYIDLCDESHQMRAKESNVRPYDHSIKNVRETIRFCMPAYITTKDGQTHRLLVALDRVQMYELNEFLATLNK